MINSIESEGLEMSDTQTLALADQFAKSIEDKMSLPAALCDSLLIDEIRNIPNKMGFKIGEVAELLNIKQYVLRYWESEFEVLKPKKAANNQRYYTKKDVENAFLIRKLLHRDRFSIEGARSAIRDLKSFVKSEVKKEDQAMAQAKVSAKVAAISNSKIEMIQDRVDDILMDIARMKLLFQSR